MTLRGCRANCCAVNHTALKLAKDAINAALHAQGFENVQRAAFNAHQLAHTHYRLHQDGSFMDRSFTPGYKAQTKAE